MVAITSSLIVAALTLFQGSLASKIDVVKRADNRRETPSLTTKQFGESRGTFFTDFSIVAQGHRRVSVIHMLGCGKNEHIGEIGLHYEALSPPYSGIAIGQHGLSSGQEVMISLEKNQYIRQVDVSSYQAPIGKGKTETRIGSITLTASDGTKLTCGKKDAADPTVSWSFPDHAFLFFSGFVGTEINALTAKFIPLANYF